MVWQVINRSGVRHGTSTGTGLPDSFDPLTKRNVKWVVELGSQTHSTPVVAGGRIFIGTNNANPRDPRHIGVRALFMCPDEQDGHLHWQLVVPKLEDDDYLDWPNTGIASEGTVEGERVHTVTNRGEVVCLDVRGMPMATMELTGMRAIILPCADSRPGFQARSIPISSDSST